MCALAEAQEFKKGFEAAAESNSALISNPATAGGDGTADAADSLADELSGKAKVCSAALANRVLVCSLQLVHACCSSYSCACWSSGDVVPAATLVVHAQCYLGGVMLMKGQQ